MSILNSSEADFSFELDVVIVGAGACGLSAGLAAQAAGGEVLILERDPSALGTSAMSTGLIPGAGTSAQKAANIVDSSETFARDICAKSKFSACQGIRYYY